MTPHVSSHYRQTIAKIFPAGGNIEWRQVLAMLEEVGTVTHEHNGKFAVTLGPETETVAAPRGKDIDRQLTVDLRRLLQQAGYGPEEAEPVPDTRQRDHGDGRGGNPADLALIHRWVFGVVVISLAPLESVCGRG